MTDPSETGQKPDAPLTPEALALLGKARRSFGISIGILLLGFMAIGFALVYRAMRDAPPPAVAESVQLPQGAELVSALVADGTIQVTYRIDGIATLSLFDQATGEIVRSIVLAPQRP